MIVGELDFIAGGRKNYRELVIGVTMHTDQTFTLIRAGYRYMEKNGLLIRVAPQLLIADSDRGFFWFGVSVGYSF